MEKREPISYFDILSIIEHPEFARFYDDLLREGLVGEIAKKPTGQDVLGDIITVGLKSDYQKYDLFWPVEISIAEEELRRAIINIDSLESFTLFKLDDLRKFVGKGEKFVSEEITARTRFGEYVVDASLFNAKSYNEYLQKIVGIVADRTAKVSARNVNKFPALQFNVADIAKIVDEYIRIKLFDLPFNPFEGENWKILLMKNGVVTEHIVKEIGKAVYEMQKQVDVKEAVMEKRYFSEQ